MKDEEIPPNLSLSGEVLSGFFSGFGWHYSLMPEG